MICPDCHTKFVAYHECDGPQVRDPSRRIKAFAVEPWEMLQILRGEPLCFPLLPADAEFRNVWFDSMSGPEGAWLIFVEHPAFAPVYSGETVPREHLVLMEGK